NHTKNIRVVQTELRALLLSMGQTIFEIMAVCSDKNVRRLNIQYMAVTFVLMEMFWETCLIRDVERQAVDAFMPRNKTRPVCKT
ncbi:hypothetical protein, partial [Salmonella enterica]|uniref:hypothetical protein n=1 Tax=Salmonella enterica TaxID=28901 RepID=UPI0028921159